MTRDISGPVSISLLACWVSFLFFSGSVEGGTIILKSDLLKRLLWNEKSKEISSFKILGRASDSVLVVSTVR